MTGSPVSRIQSTRPVAASLAALALICVAACGTGSSPAAATSPTARAGATPTAKITVGASDPWILYHWPRNTGTDQIDAEWLIRPDGSGQHLLVPDLETTPLGWADWSPDGRRIAFTAEQGARSDLWVVNADSSGARRLVSCNEPCNTINFPVWSHDGRKIMFGQDNLPAGPGGVPSRFEFKVLDLSSTKVTTLFSEPKGMPAELARWSPDDRQIVFRRARLSPAGDETGGALFVADLQGRHQFQVTPWTAFADHPDWGRDGRIVFDEPVPGQISAVTNLFLIRPDGAGLTPLTTFTGGFMAASQPHWTPDGAGILFKEDECVGGSTLAACSGVPGWALTHIGTIKPDGTGIGLSVANGVSGGHVEARPVP